MKKHMDLDPYDISEDQIKIEDKDWDDDDVQVLWTRHMIQHEKMGEYWKPDIADAKEAFEYEKGNIFSDKQRLYMETKEDKYPIEPRLMEPRIYSAIGQIIKARRSGAVTTEGGSIDEPAESAKACELASMIMKDMETKFHERRLTKDILHDALVGGYPVWAWVEMAPPSSGQTLRCRLLPWDSTATAPFHWRASEEITCFAYYDLLKPAECEEVFPNMVDQIRAHVSDHRSKDLERITTMSEWEGAISSSDRSKVMNIATEGRNNLLVPDGYLEVCYRIFHIRRKEKIAINLENPNDFEIRPPLWDDERWESFLADRAKDGVEYTEETRKVTILWETAGSTSGLMLRNEKNWFQEDGMFPGVPLIAAQIDGDFTSLGRKMKPNILKAACAETEFLDEVRKGSGSLWILRNGFITNIENFQSEVSKRHGVLTVSSDVPGNMDMVAKVVQNKPNTATLEYAQKTIYDMDGETRIGEAMQGGSNPEQSNVAKMTEITQGLIALSEYVENFNNWWEAFQNLKCRLIPYGYDQYDILEITDEQSGQNATLEINAPVTDVTGEVVAVANDLSAHRFKFKINPVDDSPTAKEELQRQAVVFLNAVPGPMAAIDPSGELLALFMMAMPNRILSDVGKRLLERAKERAASQQQMEQSKVLMEGNEKLQKLKNEAEKLKAQKVKFSISGADLAQYPMLKQLLAEIGYFAPTQGPVPPAEGALPMPGEPAAGMPGIQPQPQLQ